MGCEGVAQTYQTKLQKGTEIFSYTDEARGAHFRASLGSSLEDSMVAGGPSFIDKEGGEKPSPSTEEPPKRASTWPLRNGARAKNAAVG